MSACVSLICVWFNFYVWFVVCAESLFLLSIWTNQPGGGGREEASLPPFWKQLRRVKGDKFNKVDRRQKLYKRNYFEAFINLPDRRTKRQWILLNQQQGVRVKCQETSVKALLRHSHGYWTAGCCQQPCIRILARHPRAVAPLLNWAAAVKNYFERAPDDCIIWPYVSMLEKWTPKRNNLMFPYVMNISCEKYMYMLVQIVIKTKINFEHLLFFLLRTISWFHVCATRCLM